MKPTYKRKWIIETDHCGASTYLNVISPFYFFQDIATNHADELKVGMRNLRPNGLYWVVTNTRIDFISPAYYHEEIEIETWPEKCNENDVRTYRSYIMRRGKDIIAKGKSEWVVLSTSNWPVPFSKIGFPTKLKLLSESAIEDKARKYITDIAEYEQISTYKVQSTDIDMAVHMNNVKYIQLLLNQYSAKEIDENSIASIEIKYSKACLEKETLSIFRKIEGKTHHLLIQKEDGSPSTYAVIKFR